MATVVNSQNFKPYGGPITVTAYATLTAVGQATDWVRFVDTDVTVQVDGSASSATVVVERTIIDPDAGIAFSYAPVYATPISGNPATGIPPNVYTEPGLGWWRARLTGLTGAAVTVSLVGSSQP